MAEMTLPALLMKELTDETLEMPSAVTRLRRKAQKEGNPNMPFQVDTIRK